MKFLKNVFIEKKKVLESLLIQKIHNVPVICKKNKNIKIHLKET